MKSSNAGLKGIALAMAALALVFSVCCGEAERKGIPFPEMRSVADQGKIYAASELEHEYTLIFMPMDNAEANQTAIDAVYHFEEVESIKFNKFVLGKAEKDSIGVFPGWKSVIVPEKFEEGLVNEDHMAFLTLFKNGKFTERFVSKRENSNIMKGLVLKNLYYCCLGLKEDREIVEYHKPENYLDPNQFTTLSEPNNSAERKTIIFIVQKPGQICKDGKQVISRAFEKYVSEVASFQGVVLVNNDYSDKDVEALKHNWKMNSDVGRISKKMQNQLDLLNKANVGYKANLVITIQGGVEIM